MKKIHLCTAILIGLFATQATAKVDPTIPIVLSGDCTAAGSWIPNSEMRARMADQKHAAKVIMSGVQFDDSGRKLEAYYDPVDMVWYVTIRKRSLNADKTMWTSRSNDPTCLYAFGDPLPFPPK